MQASKAAEPVRGARRTGKARVEAPFVSLERACIDLLRANDRGGYTVPSPRLYPHQWAWDSAFAAIGWAHIDLDRAVTELELLMQGQWPDGRIPHIRFHKPSADYFPGPDFWGTRDRSSITQPPVWASAARRLLELGGDGRRIRALLGPIDRSHQFFRIARDPLGYDAVAVVHPWESGLDNSPAWDSAMAAIDPTKAPPFQRVDKKRVGDPSQRPTDDHYKRYVVLVKAIADSDFGPGPLAVYDPMMTAILARAEEDLEWLADQLGHSELERGRGTRLCSGLMSRLYNPALERFSYYDAAAGERLEVDVVGAYLPAMLDLPVSARVLERLRQSYWTEWPLPSTSPEHPEFDPVRYWRGPTWVNVNWLVADRLPGLKERTLELIERSGFCEYFNPLTGEGLGAREFSWTAALALDWLRGCAM